MVGRKPKHCHSFEDKGAGASLIRHLVQLMPKMILDPSVERFST